jgi:IS30 family transposase
MCSRKVGSMPSLWVLVAQHRVKLAALPEDERRKEEHHTAGLAHLLLPIASLHVPTGRLDQGSRTGACRTGVVRYRRWFPAPGSPWQNGHNENCNGVWRDGQEVLHGRP